MEETFVEKKPIAGWKRAIYYIFIWILCQVIMAIPFLIFSKDAFSKKQTNATGTFDDILTEIAQLIGTILAIFICRKYIDKKPFLTFGFQFNFKDFLLGCIIGIALISISCFTLVGADWVDISSQSFNLQQLSRTFLLFVLVAITEEFMCRTYLLSSLIDSLGKYQAVAVVSLFFGIMHFFNPNFSWISFGDITISGVFMGLWYAYRRNIWFPVGVHLMWNYFQGAIYGFEVSGLKLSGQLFHITRKSADILSGGSFGIEGSIITLIITIIGCVLLDNYLRKTTTNESK
jgi:uncharacterized protein